jgi:quercetin dioxygenase-like cupin family protein
VRYVRIHADERGGSRFSDVEHEGTPTHVVDGVPPLLISGPFGATGAIFAEQPADAPDWTAHVAPRRQWIIVLQGRVSVTVSDGESREFGPGGLLFVEDTEGEGHVSKPLTPDFAFVMIPATS